jgi:acetyl-CoA carboxylase carboxyltransferase component
MSRAFFVQRQPYNASDGEFEIWSQVMSALRDLTQSIENEQCLLRQGTGAAGLERQHRTGRIGVRDRLQRLLDPGTELLELGLWAAWKMYPDWGDVPAAGVVTGLGQISGQTCMIVANDATVKAGALFPQSVKKILRAQKIAKLFRVPVIYLVDSAGVFLPDLLQQRAAFR